MKKMQLPYISAYLLMERWKVYPLDIYVLIVTADFRAYQIIGSKKIIAYTPPDKEHVDIGKTVEGLLFKPEDVLDIENKYDLANNKKADKAKSIDSPEILKMIKAAEPEIKKLYTQIKNIGFSGREQTTSEQYKAAVNKFYRENKNEFKIIKESYLSDWSLYTFRDGHQKGDFIGKLLQKVANDQNLDIDNYQVLYKMYKSTKRLKK